MSIHLCHWPGCQVEVPPRLWGCKTHWYTLPPEIRRKIWREYRPGQEITKTPSLAYIAVAKEAHEWAINYVNTLNVGSGPMVRNQRTP